MSRVCFLLFVFRRGGTSSRAIFKIKFQVLLQDPLLHRREIIFSRNAHANVLPLKASKVEFLNFKEKENSNFASSNTLDSQFPNAVPPIPRARENVSRDRKCNLINSKLLKTLRRFLLKLINHHNPPMCAAQRHLS